MFEILITVAVQSVFRLQIHQNKIFLFFKNYFLYQHIKMIQKHKKKIFILSKNNSKFKRIWFANLLEMCRIQYEIFIELFKLNNRVYALQFRF